MQQCCHGNRISSTGEGGWAAAGWGQADADDVGVETDLTCLRVCVCVFAAERSGIEGRRHRRSQNSPPLPPPHPTSLPPQPRPPQTACHSITAESLLGRLVGAAEEFLNYKYI